MAPRTWSVVTPLVSGFWCQAPAPFTAGHGILRGARGLPAAKGAADQPARLLSAPRPFAIVARLWRASGPTDNELTSPYVQVGDDIGSNR